MKILLTLQCERAPKDGRGMKFPPPFPLHFQAKFLIQGIAYGKSRAFFFFASFLFEKVVGISGSPFSSYPDDDGNAG